MLFECPHCGSAFGASSRRCPRCGDFEPAVTDRIPFLANKAEEALNTGASLEAVREWLVDEGVPPSQAESLAGECHGRLRSEALKTGSRRLALGLVLVFASVIIFGIFMKQGRLPVGFAFPPFGCGVWLMVLGWQTLRHGREADRATGVE